MKRVQRRHLLITAIILLCIISTGAVLWQQSPFNISVSPTLNQKKVGHAPETQKTTTGSIQLAAHPMATPTPMLAPTPTPASAGWTLIFRDNFSGTQLNPAWGKYGGPHGGGKSYYDPGEVQVQNGLHVWIERKTTNGLLYTSGGLAAFGLAQIYGKYEFSAKLPRGKGIGPYTILWPKSSQPNTAQIDLFESPPVNKDKLYCTNHGVDGSSGQIIANGNFADAFHTFTYEWMPDKIRFLIDGVQQGMIVNNIPTFPMWFGIAVSSGDAFTGDPDPTTVLPVSLDVQWVHIYKYNR